MQKVKTFFSILFNRMTILVILICIQFGWLFFAMLKLGNYTKYTYAAFSILSILMALVVIYKDANPAYKLGWVLLICLLPILGTFMYLLFADKRPARRLRNRLYPVIEEHKKDLFMGHGPLEWDDERLRATLSYVSDYCSYPAWKETSCQYFAEGEAFYRALLTDLRKAEHSIFIEFYIIASGALWDAFLKILKEKAAQGVDVRLMYDDVGSMNRLPFSFAEQMEKMGIKVVAFNPLRPIASVVYNHRDHRKIVVIDGYIAYSGGCNLADEYINHIERFGHWKDNGIRLYGRAVWNFTVMFLDMWNAFNKKGRKDDYRTFLPDVYIPGPFPSDGLIQPFGDSPLDNENVGETVYMELINQARDYVYIATPYLILDNEMITCMKVAAKRGVDIRIITPGIPDKRTIHRLSRSYYGTLLEAGVKIYEYSPGFIHAKSFLVDDRVAVVGTINLDYRSLYLHFECATLIIGSEALPAIKKDYEETFRLSRLIGRKGRRTTFVGLLADSILRVLSPLL